MIFNLELLEKYPLSRVDSDSGRYYEADGEKYPSVTSILNHVYPTDWLDDWRERVGKENADKTMTYARNRGTAMHLICEQFLLNQDYKRKAMPVNLEAFTRIKPILEKNVSTIYGIELPLYSKTLKAAGTTDAVLLWENKPSILDFKNVKRPKRLEDIENYLVQTTFYSIMVEELYGMMIEQLVIFLSVDHSEPTIFKVGAQEYRPKVYEIMRNINETGSTWTKPKAE